MMSKPITHAISYAPSESDPVANAKGKHEGDKTTDIIPGELPVASLLNHQEVVALLSTNGAIRQIIMILRNGKAAWGKPHAFPAHDNLLQRMDFARRNGHEDDFLMALRLYLERVPIFVPHTGREEQVEGLLDQVTTLMLHESIGFRIVADKILSVMNAPVN